MRHSLARQLYFRMLPLVAPTAVLAWAWLSRRGGSWSLAVICIFSQLAIMAWVIRSALAPLHVLFRALSGSVNSYKDGEYNFSVYWDSNDELGELVKSHSELGTVLRKQRQGIVQRELLLDTMVQNTPVAMVLASNSSNGSKRIVYANLAARQLLNNGVKLEGHNFDAILKEAPPQLRDALDRRGDSLFSTPGEDEQVYHLARRNFRLNGRLHELVLIRQLTTELRRQEVQVWKKVIQVISHELNNSLGPVASLAHSGSELVKRGENARLGEVFSTIEERARHLERFVRGYTSFAKLPQPQLQDINWNVFLDGLQRQVQFKILPNDTGILLRFDPAQMEQALLNLVKNAHEASLESGPNSADISIGIAIHSDWVKIEVLDRGPGMRDAVLQKALVPFYSTKRNGSGIGLALTREIVEAHGGRLSLHNRSGGGLCVSIQLPAKTATTLGTNGIDPLTHVSSIGV